MKKGEKTYSHFDSVNKLIRLPESKHSQIAVFVIIGIIIIGVVISFLIIRTSDKEVSFNFLPFNKQALVLRESLMSCMNAVYEQELDIIGVQGGYYNLPLTPYLDAGLYDIPFYYFGELDYVPDSGLIEEELANAVELRITECFDIIDEKNIDYNFNYRSINVSIQEDKVVFLPDLILTLKKGENSIETDFKNYPAEINSALKEMNGFASYIAYDYEINDEGLCMSCYLDISNGNGLIVDISTDIDSVLIVSLIDNKTDYHPQVYSFAFTHLTEFNNSEFLIPPILNSEILDQEIQEETTPEPPEA